MPLGRWLETLAREGRLGGAGVLRGRILELHYRACFHPRGLDEHQHEELSRRVEAWVCSRGGAHPPR
jgi:hypothetical protein